MSASEADAVTEIRSKAEFDALLAAHPLVALQAHATWCGPCKAISPIFAKLAAARTPGLAFARFDSDVVEPLAQELGIRALPTFVFFRGGDKVDTLTGANPAALQKAVEKLRAEADAPLSTNEDF
ncbi:hypothetical protein CDD83_6814 [Cordyceps sp. RAO-2017]|nr:hypothetical protein CDD83_6814 [Cordyceps sp. RAO-2017]